MNVEDTSTSGKIPATQDERTWGMIAHLSAFAGVLVPLVGNIIAPLLIWQIKRDKSAFIADQAREAVNFNITIAIGAAVCLVLTLVLIGFLLGFALIAFWVVMTIIAAIKAGEGVAYRYPVALRLVK